MELVKWLETVETDLGKIREVAGTFGYGDDPLYDSWRKSEPHMNEMKAKLQGMIGKEICKKPHVN